jgi:hypothetical protein
MDRRMTRWTIGALGVMVLGWAAAPTVSSQAAAASSQTGPVQMTRDQDFERTRGLLGLSGAPPAGAVNGRPETFDESQANPYPTLPDPLTLNNGQKVTTAATWNTQRRAELLELFEREVYGRRPKNIPRVKWEVISTTKGMNGQIPVITKELRGHVENSTFPAIQVHIEASVSTPADATGPVPVILSYSAPGFGFARGQGDAAGPAQPTTTTCGITPPRAGGPAPAATGVAGATPAAGAAGPAIGGAAARGGAAGPGRGAAGGAPPLSENQQMALALGWGYASVNTGSIQADNGQGLTCGIIGLVNKGQPRSVEDWGVLSAWGWGASRVLDYFETDKAVDATRVALYGHSRWGKATLVGSVFDPRFAVAYVSSSGQGGAKLHRRKYGETIDNVANTFYYWMGGNYIKYAGNWDKMPVDSHELVALMAPRPVFFSGGNDPQRNPDGSYATRVDAQGNTILVNGNDAWVDPKGTFMAAQGAEPVYTLLGKKGLGVATYPPLDTRLITGDLGFHQHPGGHTSGPAWATFYLFASKYFNKPTAVARR